MEHTGARIYMGNGMLFVLEYIVSATIKREIIRINVTLSLPCQMVKPCTIISEGKYGF
jgi:hypothetical protein